MAKVTYSGPIPADDPMFTGRYEIFSSTNTRADDPTFQEPVSAADGPKTVIHNADYWVKVVEFLQQNWALVDEDADGRSRIFFINDASGIFDELVCETPNEAREALIRNRFLEFSASADLQSFLRPPPAPFHRGTHPNGPIYSSGRFWV